MDKFLLYSDERTLDTYLHGHFLLWIMGKFKNRQLHYIACITSGSGMECTRVRVILKKNASPPSKLLLLQQVALSKWQSSRITPKPLLLDSNILLKKNLDVTVLYIYFKWKIILRHLVQSLLTTKCPNNFLFFDINAFWSLWHLLETLLIIMRWLFLFN